MAFTNTYGLTAQKCRFRHLMTSSSRRGGDSSGETEAGITQRDIVRLGVAEISVAFQVSPAWLKTLSAMRSLPRLSVDFFNTETMVRENREMYMDGFKVSLAHDTSKKGLWKVSFTLKEY